MQTTFLGYLEGNNDMRNYYVTINISSARCKPMRKSNRGQTQRPYKREKT